LFFFSYDWRFLRSIVSIGYVGWIAYSLLFIIKTYVLEGTSQHLTSTTSAKPATKPLTGRSTGHLMVNSLKYLQQQQQQQLIRTL
jgi:hypothetical protein